VLELQMSPNGDIPIPPIKVKPASWRGRVRDARRGNASAVPANGWYDAQTPVAQKPTRQGLPKVAPAVATAVHRGMRLQIRPRMAKVASARLAFYSLPCGRKTNRADPDGMSMEKIQRVQT
jgi:hypothetical protein